MLIVAALIATVAASFQGAAKPAAAATCAQNHVVRAGETLWRISQMYRTTVAALQSVNGMVSGTRIYVGQNLCIRLDNSDTSMRTYTVQHGDTLISIARKFGISWQVLARVNGITNVNRIYVGQKLKIPEVTIQS
jgi:spore germination protein